MRRYIAAMAALLAIALGGCLGGDDDSNRESAYRPPIGAATGFEVKESLLPRAASVAPAPAAGVARYEPEGEIVADSGFRPAIDGFAFENYGNDEAPHNLGPAEMAGRSSASRSASRARARTASSCRPRRSG